MASNEGLNRGTFGLGREVYHEIFFDRPPELGVPTLQMVKQIVPGEANRRLQFRWDVAGDFTVIMGGSTESGIPLRVWSEVVEPDPALLRASSTNYQSVMASSDFRQLTYQNLLPETLALVDNLTKDAATGYDKVIALNDWLQYRGGFVYTRDIPLLSRDNPVDAFILQEKRGHCELYASALALMVRSLGIPTRVVSGYRGGAWNESDESYTVTMDMAHLWAEIYFPNAGWIPFDPSPPQESPALFSIDTLARNYSRYVLKARFLWQSNVVSYSPAVGTRFFRDTVIGAVGSIGGESGGFGLPDSRRPILTGMKGPFIVLAGLLSVLLAAVLVLRRTRRRAGGGGFPLTGDQRRALKVHRLFSRRIRHFGVDCVGMTAEEMGQEVSQLNLNDPDSALDVLSAYSASRFGRQGLSSSRFKELRRAVRRLRVVAQ